MECKEAIDVMGDAVGGRLRAAIRAGFEEHMTECAPCRTYLEHLRLTRKALQLMPSGGGTSRRRNELLKAFRDEFERKGD